ncbi:MAG TPA: alpha/beta fold hydrolase [Candidatus Krumholzibacteria bacterium]
MVRRTAACLLALVVLVSCHRKSEPPAPQEAAKKLGADESRQFSQLTIRQIMQGPGIVGTAPSNLRFSADGRQLFFEWNDPAPLDSMNATDPEDAYHHYLDLEHRAGTYRMDLATLKAEKLTKAAADTTAPDDSAWDREKRHRAELRGGDVYAVDAKSGGARRITDTVDAESEIQISPDGGTIYFTRDHQLYATPFAGGLIRQVTNLATSNNPDDKKPNAQKKFLVDQQKDLFDELKEHGPKDWKKDHSRPRKLYLGEGFTITGTRVSPTGRFVSVLLTKEASGVRKPVIPLVVTESGYTETDEVRTPVGEAQDETKLAFMDVDGDSLLWLASDEGMIIDVMGWSPARDVLLVRGITADYHDRYFWAVSPGGKVESGKITPDVLDRFQDAAWVDGPSFYETGGWLPDGDTVYFISEADKWGHLYTVNLAGKRTQLTRGEFEVYGASFDAARQRWLIVSNEGAAGSQRLWSMDPDGSNRRVMTPNRGWYEVAYAADFSRAAVMRSEWTAPPELHLLDLASGTLDGPLTQSTTTVFRSFPWLAPETLTFPASDGVQVSAHLFDPARFGAQPNGAGVIFIHGAGYLQNVIDGWPYYYREYMFNCFLAAHGYTVLNVDYRGSAGYGRDCRTAIYKHMGGRDLDDIVDGARWLVAERGVGAKQIGVYGGSYGGFLTLMALFRYPDEITSGAGLRSVTDWAHYNHWFTVRILGTPADDPEAYRRSSPIYFADGFNGHLEMLHGLRDDNVLAEDVIRLSQRLIELGKDDWNLTLYPVESHAFKRASSWTDEMTRAWKLFERTLPGPARPAP